MKTVVRKTLCILLALMVTAFVFAGCRKEEEKVEPSVPSSSVAEPSSEPVPSENDKKEAEPVTVAIREINKHGNLMLETTFDELKSYDMEVGDLITVFVGDTAYELPIGTAYTDVDSGNMVLRFDLEDDEVSIAINMGNFASETGIGTKETIDEEPGYRWNVKVSEVRLLLKEKKGYINEYNARHLERTDAREDYASLTDEEFANFRAVSVSGLKKEILFRSSTPIEPAIGRNEYAMKAMEMAGVKSVINLDDTEETMKGYETFEGSYYSTCRIINPEMSYDFMTEEFAEKVKESVLFIIENDGPFLIHCKEGKDRTGMLCAILECFAGAPLEDVEEDYMITYHNFYGVEKGDPVYDIILNNNLVKTLSALFGTEDLGSSNICQAAYDYLISAGLSAEQLDILGQKLLEK